MLGPDGSLDRAALAALVFADAAARARLNAIVHPRVRAEEARRAADVAGAGAALLVTDAALLVEAGAHLRFDRLVVVHCDPGQQLERLRARDGLDEGAARARVLAQMPLAEKRSFAHFEVDTSGSIADTDQAADALARQLDGLACGRPGPSGIGLDVLVGGLLHGPETGPRGLSPLALLAAAAEAGGLEMEALAARLTPPAGRPWYRTAGEAEAGAPATSLSVALAAWALRRGGPDPAFLAAAAGSVARLTHTDPAERADACLLALVAQAIALDPGRVGGRRGAGGEPEPAGAAVRGRGAVRTAPSGPGGGPPSSARPRGCARRVRPKGRRRRSGRERWPASARRSSRRPAPRRCARALEAVPARRAER